MKLYAVSIASVAPECEIAIMVGEDGKSTNRWADGTAGVQRRYRALAEESFDPGCDLCLGEESA